MALISCTECGNQVSDKARSCPRCGAPVVRASMDQECPFRRADRERQNAGINGTTSRSAIPGKDEKP